MKTCDGTAENCMDETCQEHCPHDWEDGVCLTCNLTLGETPWEN